MQTQQDKALLLQYLLLDSSREGSEQPERPHLADISIHIGGQGKGRGQWGEGVHVDYQVMRVTAAI